MRYKKYLLSAVLAFSGMLVGNTFLQGEQASAKIQPLGCDKTTEFNKSVATDQAWKEYLNLVGIKTSITLGTGKTVAINKAQSLAECIPIYGTGTDVPTKGSRQVQERLRTSSGETFWKYQGYTEKGTPILDSRYKEEGTTEDYMQRETFIINPSTNSGLTTSIKYSKVKPEARPQSKWDPVSYWDPDLKAYPTFAQTLDRSVDRRYANFCSGSCSHGIKGYLDDVNVATKKTWTGAQLVQYISYEVTPSRYAPGIWNVYRKDKNGTYWFNPSYTLPYKRIGKEDADLEIKIKTISPNPVMESYKYTVTYQICNRGEKAVQNPVISYGDKNGSTRKTALKITIEQAQCYTGTVSDAAREVNSDTTATYRMVVNPDNNNPKEAESNRGNNTSTKTFKIINKVINGGITITKVTPTYPHSNESTTIHYTISNNSNVPVYNVRYQVGYQGRLVTRYISEMEEYTTYRSTLVQTAPEVMAYQEDVKVRGIIGRGFEEDVDANNNSATRIVTVRNPDAYVHIKGVNDADNVLSKINITVHNKTFNTITNKCSAFALGCLSSSAPQTFTYNLYDTKLTADTSDDVLVKSYTTDTYSIAHEGSKTFTIDRAILKNWVETKYPNSYQAVQFRVTATIPSYKREVDWYGVAQYQNNTATNYFNYIPPRDITFNECTEIKHSNLNYFKLHSGVNPIKMCLGHYPTYPSTQIEKGMQAYHYVLYRFFAQPMPRYEVTNLINDNSNSNYFSQLTLLQSQYEAKDVKGDEMSMIFPNKVTNGFQMERGRYLPSGGTFKFSIYEKKKDGTQGKQIAIGTITHQIPSTCYDPEHLDLLNQNGCNDVIFFLPNNDNSDNKYKKPANYNTTAGVNYPVTKTRVPYLNPGLYTFTFEGTETFKYYYQTNLSTDKYNWSNPMFK